MNAVLDFIVQTILGELIVVVVGVLFANFIKNRYDEWRYGNWTVRVVRGEEQIVDRPISPRKAQEILDESADLAVFLKGVTSPYGWINCDIISDGERLGLLNVDRGNRVYVIDLDKNPMRDDQQGANHGRG